MHPPSLLLALPMIIFIGGPTLNKDYQKAHFPGTPSRGKPRRVAIVEQPKATPASPPAVDMLREMAR
jgi:hypothetical protein